MRIAIREQLALLVILTVLLSLTILAVPTWVYVYRFVVGVLSDALSLTASLKAARISSEVELIQTACSTTVTRVLIQQALMNFYKGDKNDSNWDAARTDLQSALASVSGELFQARVYSRNGTSNSTQDLHGLVSITAKNVSSITLPYLNSQGQPAMLGDADGGYPTALYPNITYQDSGIPSQVVLGTDIVYAWAFPEVRLSQNGGLLLGPMPVNDSFALLSLTVPMRSNNDTRYIIGYMTVVASASTIFDAMSTREGLGDTGNVLIVGPASIANRFPAADPPSNGTFVPDANRFGNELVRYVLPPISYPGQMDRHPGSDNSSSGFNQTFPVRDYPAVWRSFTQQNNAVNNATAALWETNNDGFAVSVGSARPQTSLVNWTVVVEQAQSEALAPIFTLRDILLGCVFGTLGLVILVVWPLAHLGVLPIRRLRDATKKSITPPGYHDDLDQFELDNTQGLRSGSTSKQSIQGLMAWIRREIRHRRRKRHAARLGIDPSRRVFMIPGKVPDEKHWVTDELTELTTTYNDMTDELLKQYTTLENKVQARTAELEISKQAAEAANESKTLFIANISHELKTPLNGIMGMCAVCMEEDDITRIKSSLRTLYKSGDLLLHLLEDLLSFSKNQIGHQVQLEEKEFRLGEIRSQMLAIFDKQVREGRIHFSAEFVGPDPNEISGTSERNSLDMHLPALGPAGIGRLKDMCLWGDQHRILQVIINLVGNGLKFTPPGGKVSLKIRCVEEVMNGNESRSSSFSRVSIRPGRSRHGVGSNSANSIDTRSGQNAAAQTNGTTKGTALAINPLEPMSAFHHERSGTPPPLHAKTYVFEFEVQDTGPGIAPAMQSKVFEPFVQADLGLSKRYGGTGLGLSICQQLASLMGGGITLASTVGVGSTFTMRIPLKYVKDRASSVASNSQKGSRPGSVSSVDVEHKRQSHEHAIVPATEAQVVANPATLETQPRLIGLSQPFFANSPAKQVGPTSQDKMAVINQAMAAKRPGEGKLRVLVADDNNTNIEVVSRMLKLEDVVDVTIAKDGQEAYELVKANFERHQRFDVIFMDIQMPNLDGLQSTRLIRGLGYQAPIVALTAFSEESNIKECMDSGMNEFLAKPIRRPALKKVLQKFATIPEEPETSSLTRKSTPETTPATEQTNSVTLSHVEEIPTPASSSVSPGTAEPGPKLHEKFHVNGHSATLPV